MGAWKPTKENIKDTIGIQEGKVKFVSHEAEGDRPGGPYYEVTQPRPADDGTAKNPYLRMTLPMVMLDEDGGVVGDVDVKSFMVSGMNRNGEFSLLPSEDGETPASNDDGEEGGVGAKGPYLVPMRPDPTVSPRLGYGKLVDSAVKLGFDWPEDVNELVGLAADVRTEEEKYKKKGSDEEQTSRNLVLATKPVKGKAGKTKAKAKQPEPEPEEVEEVEEPDVDEESVEEADAEAVAKSIVDKVYSDAKKDSMNLAMVVSQAKVVAKKQKAEDEVLEFLGNTTWLAKLAGYKYDKATKKLVKGK